MMNKWVKSFQILVVILLTACTSSLQTPTIKLPTASQPAIPTEIATRVLPTPTPLFSPTATPASLPSSTPPSTSTPQANFVLSATQVVPFATGPSESSFTWSPDAHWLPLIDFTHQTLQFVDMFNATACDFPYPISYPGPYHFLTWLGDGQVVVQAAGQVVAGMPCGNFNRANEAEALALARADPSYSPDGRFQAIEERQPQGSSPDDRLVIYQVSSGKIASEAAFDGVIYAGSFPLPGSWIDSSHFLVYYTRDQGPLLMVPGKPAINIARDIFNLAIAPSSPDFETLMARESMIAGSSAFHLVLFGPTMSENNRPFQIYHSEASEASETGLVETLPCLASQCAISADGHWVLFTTDTTQGEQTLIRPVDPPGSAFQPFSGQETPLSWSPDGSKYLVVSQDQTTISVYSAPDGGSIGSWQAPGYELFPSWSPDGRSLSVWGRRSEDSGQEAIFVIRLPGK